MVGTRRRDRGVDNVIVLGIDTATPRTSLALVSEEGVLASVSLAGMARRDVAVPALERLLAWSGMTPSDLGGVAVGVGPGLFTGLRSGIGAGKTLAQVLRIPIVGVRSTEALAHAVRDASETVISVIDGRRREVFHAAYRVRDGEVEPLTEPAVERPEALAERLGALGPVLLVGDGAILYRDVLAATGARVAPAILAYPSATSVAELARPALVSGDAGGFVDVVPLYLRKTDAEIDWDRRAGGVVAP